MKFEKLPSGNYRITKQVNGKRYRATLDHKPSKAEADQVIQELIEQSSTLGSKDMTFRSAGEGYIDLKSSVLSPSTKTGYRSALRQISPDFAEMSINRLDNIIVQKEINNLAKKGLSPKTVRNLGSFVKTVLKMYRPQLNITISMPPKRHVEYHTPTSEMVQMVLKHEQGTEYYVPYSLAVLSLRRSEICALDVSDISGNMILVHKAKIKDRSKDGKELWVIKEYGKTEKSHRKIFLPDALLSTILDQGYIYKGSPDNLLKHLHKTQDALGLPHFRLHDFRHYFSSYAHYIGIPDKYIQEQGGWKTDYVMKNVYRHTFEEKYEGYSSTVASQILPN